MSVQSFLNQVQNIVSIENPIGKLNCIHISHTNTDVIDIFQSHLPKMENGTLILNALSTNDSLSQREISHIISSVNGDKFHNDIYTALWKLNPKFNLTELIHIICNPPANYSTLTKLPYYSCVLQFYFPKLIVCIDIKI
jgi:hypothetical protein